MTKKQTAEAEASEPKKKKPAGGAKKAATKKPAPKKPAPKKPAPRKKRDTALKAAVEATAAAVADLVDVVDADDEIEDAQILAETPAEELDASGAVEPVIPLTEEEQQLAAIYGDDLSAPAKVHGEYQDRQTADEDRPMMPEINARDERKAHWQDRRQQRRQRRDQRDQERSQRRDPANPSQARSNPAQALPPNGGRPAAPLSQQRQGQLPLPAQVRTTPPAPVMPTNGHDHDALARVGTPLGDAAATVFAQLRNGQPLPVRQLAAMMRKRSLVEIDPEQLAPQLKAELLGDERSYRTLGLRPRIVYRGRDLFAPGPVSMSVTAEAEAGFAAALSRLAGATHRALAQRISKASPAGFERLIHAYLVAAGYREIEWVKRTGGISYASATAPGIDRTVLISARSGDSAIDRRGIGELRVGVEAKNLVAGILFSARELSEDAEKELERAGRSVAVVCGDQLVAALIANGVGVVSAAAPLRYVDDQLLDELLAG
ncbi:MAG: restriction endonuclease [Kofleriaceae bacterium]